MPDRPEPSTRELMLRRELGLTPDELREAQETYHARGFLTMVGYLEDLKETRRSMPANREQPT
ncbi:MAG TPA: hypothetical protein VG965_06610 [Patescibacteria group bacterium]|nr:hypothetical protein [Patescibacteria group bacterium]